MDMSLVSPLSLSQTQAPSNPQPQAQPLPLNNLPRQNPPGCERVFYDPQGQPIRETQLYVMLSQLHQAYARGERDPETRHTYLWMLSQHYPEHLWLGGHYWGPPKGTLQEVLNWWNKETLGGFYRQQQIENARPPQLAVQRMGQQQQQPRQAQRPQPASSSNQSIPPTMVPVPDRPGQPFPLNPTAFAPNMVPSQHCGLYVNPALENGGTQPPQQIPQQISTSSPGSQNLQRADFAFSPQGPQQNSAPLGSRWGVSEPGAAGTLQRAVNCHSATMAPRLGPPGMIPMAIPNTMAGQAAGQSSSQTPAGTIKGHRSPSSSYMRLRSPAIMSSNMSQTSSQMSPPAVSGLNSTRWSTQAAMSTPGFSNGSVRSPSHPSPYKVPEASNNQALAAPMLSQAASAKLVQNVHEASTPEMGSWAPPTSRAPSVQPCASPASGAPTAQQVIYTKASQIKLDRPSKNSNQHVLAESINMTPGRIQELSPKKAKKWATWQRQQIEASQQQRAQVEAGPIIASQLNRIIDLTEGADLSKKRKTHSTTSSQVAKKSNTGTQRQFHANQDNCGFGPTTHIIRAQPNSNFNTPIQARAPNSQFVYLQPPTHPLPRPTRVEAEHIRTYALQYGIHALDTELGVNARHIFQQYYIHAEDVKKTKEQFERRHILQSVEVEGFVGVMNVEREIQARRKREMVMGLKKEGEREELIDWEAGISPTWRMRKE